MRWVRRFSVVLLAGFLLLAGVASIYRAMARKQARDLEASLATLPDVATNTPYPKLFFQRGVNFTAEFPSFYGSDGAVRMLRHLPEYGVNAIALVPYGFASVTKPQVRGWNTHWEGDAGITQLARVAHSLGMKVMLKPQLWSRGGNPADLNFPAAADRAQWFSDYRQFLEHYAQLAAAIHADVFCIGVELEKLSPYEAEWRGLIARVREIYSGPLTYAANFGTEFETVKFWEALDFIGIDEYYPLPEDLSTEELERKISTVQARFGKPLLFTEAGFSSVAQANQAPWDEPKRAVDLQRQAECYEALLQRFYGKPWFAGVYWWKVGTNGYGGEGDASHTPWKKPAMEVVKRWFGSGNR